MAGKSLAIAKPQFQQDIYNILYDAAENAYMTQFQSNSIENARDYDIKIKERMMKISKDFATQFAETAYKPLADIIEAYIKDMHIIINHIPKGTLISPSGPVTGVLNILPNEVEII